MNALFGFVAASFLLTSLPAWPQHTHHNRHLDDSQSSATVLEENMDDTIQAEEEVAEEEMAIRHAREVQQDDKARLNKTRFERSYLP